MFASVLIANRGEIACRIIRTARRMGIATVAVYSDADAGALHVREADRAVHIGAAPARDSYLNIPCVIDAARRAGAEAIHPGYGFLSENPALPEACAAAGLIFVGPPASAMRAMGSKAAAKALMERAGVPVLPGYHGDEQDPDFLAAQAARAGFPVVIKAVAGGGGRGMRVVQDADGFAAALASARQEGASAFGDDRVLIERYLTRPRHIEMQVFADTHGRAVHLFERDCSAQRRHQKIIEEAPAPGISQAMRDAMGRASVAAAQAVGYVGAGTVEFVAEGEGFYFLEMNTRLQVEHPVTEAITGTDLVEWQFRVAAGETLPRAQDELRARGHAIEARLYAEDPARDYAPSIGRLTVFRMPRGGVRVDTGVATGDTISVHYDAMIAKLIAHGPTRAEAVGKLRRAIAACDVAPVATNLDLLDALLGHPAFTEGGIDTGFIARNAETLLAPSPPPDAAVLTAAALGVMIEEAQAASRAAERSGDPWSPFGARDGWWLNTTPERLLMFEAEDGPHEVRLRRDGAGWSVAASGRRVAASASVREDGRMDLTLDGMREQAAVSHEGDRVIVRLRARVWRLRLPDPIAQADDDADQGGRLVAPIPGQVTLVSAEPGQTVRRGDVLVVMEAMKTVFRLTAPADGVVEAVGCRAGDPVTDGQVLVTFVTAPSPEGVGDET